MSNRADYFSRSVGMLDIVRYARGASSIDTELDGYLNFQFLTTAPDRSDKRLLLEAGINRTASLGAVDTGRRPVILLRSSPWKAGHESNPWEDVYDLDHGHVRYYGDHKPGTLGGLGATAGNKALLDAWQLHGSPKREDRLLAPPLMLFRAVPVQGPNGTVNKGHLEFCGAGIIERLEMVVQRDPRSQTTFPNLLIDVVVIDLSDRGDTLDWRWIDDRRNSDMAASDCLRHAPKAWRTWVDGGRVTLPAIRRRVLSSRVKSASDQRPMAGSEDEVILHKIYRHFDRHKHAFEYLASLVAAQIFERSGASYDRGWLTRAGGDGGMDFVGRLDVGDTGSSAPLTVLGQANCIKPSSSISPDEVARVVARLRRGWIGVFVTTGVFSKQAQVEVIDDEYPIVLVSGGLLVKEAIRLAELSFDGSIDALLDSSLDSYSAAVTHRRPEEIRAQA